jgi:hypothetical protein
MALAFSGCARDSKPAAAPTTTTSAVTSTTSAKEAAVVDAWRRYWEIYVAVASEMKLPDARLAQVATGEELKQLGSGFLAFASDGELFRGTIDLNPKVLSVDSSAATLRDCYLSHILGYDAKTNQAKGAEDPTRRLVTVSMVMADGTWKVASIRHEGDGCTGP